MKNLNLNDLKHLNQLPRQKEVLILVDNGSSFDLVRGRKEGLQIVNRANCNLLSIKLNPIGYFDK